MYRDNPYLRARMADALPTEGELIRSPSELSDRMGQIAVVATEMGYPNLGHGMNGYRAVTDVVDEKLKTTFFEHPDQMRKTVPIFAERSFVPIRRLINGESELGPWKQFYTSPTARHAPAAIALSDFFEYHVGIDLGYTLHLTDTQPDHYVDYLKNMNIIFDIVGQNLMPELGNVHPALKKLGAPQIGLKLGISRLHDVRDYAYDSRIDYKNAKTPQDIDIIQQKHALRANKRMLSNRKLVNFAVRSTTKLPGETW